MIGDSGTGMGIVWGRFETVLGRERALRSGLAGCGDGMAVRTTLEMEW
jgi:hypothetical protein